MKTNYHTHTSRCQHAIGNDEDYVLSAIKSGYEVLGFSDHTPWKYVSNFVSPNRMTVNQLPDYVNSIRSLAEKYKDQIKIRLGLECEYFPDYIYWLKNTMKEYKIEYAIFGNHYYNSDEKFRYFGKYTDSRDMLDLYEESAVEGIESGLFAYMAHPDLFHVFVSRIRSPLHARRTPCLPCRRSQKYSFGIQPSYSFREGRSSDARSLSRVLAYRR
jgi:histidinol-phosphatase (PHP family)